jgi:hypothetical protein
MWKKWKSDLLPFFSVFRLLLPSFFSAFRIPTSTFRLPFTNTPLGVIFVELDNAKKQAP